jgi:hypothetical protein
MSLNYRQRRQLFRIEAGLLRSDPQLAAMLSVFGRLSAGQRMPAWEQVATRWDHIRETAALTVQWVIVLAAAIGLRLSTTLGLLTTVVMGGRRRAPQRTRSQTGPGADGRPDPAAGADR